MKQGAIIVCLYVALASIAKAETLSDALLTAGVIEQKFSFLDQDVRSMFKGELDGFSGISVNAACRTETDICIFFVDAHRALETPSLRRYQRTLDSTFYNMV